MKRNKIHWPFDLNVGVQKLRDKNDPLLSITKMTLEIKRIGLHDHIWIQNVFYIPCQLLE